VEFLDLNIQIDRLAAARIACAAFDRVFENIADLGATVARGLSAPNNIAVWAVSIVFVDG